MKALALAALIAGCAPAAQATHATCQITMHGLDKSLAAARDAANSNDIAQTTFHSNLARMNQDILFERDCCRFEDTCLVMND